MRVRTLCKGTPSEGTLLLIKATLLVVSCLTVLSVMRPANAQAYPGNVEGKYDNGMIWSGYRLSGSGGYAAITPSSYSGRYTANWSGFGGSSTRVTGNFTMGSGWTGINYDAYYKSTVDANDINYVGYNIGAFNINTPNQSACVSVYGKVFPDATRREVEFYIVERYTTKYAIPGQGDMKASNVTIGSGTYNFYRVDKGSFVQFWSVRTSQANLGQNYTVPVSQHFAKWIEYGMRSGGDREFLILSTESLYQGGSGSTATGSVAATAWGY